MAKRMPDAQTAASRWVSGMSRQETQTKYKEGVQSLDFNPLERAAAASDAYIAGCQAGDAKRVRKLRAYGQQNWVNACLVKGSARLASGAAASKTIMQEAFSKLLPAIAAVRAALPPGGSRQARRERMIAFSDGMERYGQTGVA